MTITFQGKPYTVKTETELRHFLAVLYPPPYRVRRQLREATLKTGRSK